MFEGIGPSQGDHKRTQRRHRRLQMDINLLEVSLLVLRVTSQALEL